MVSVFGKVSIVEHGACDEHGHLTSAANPWTRMFYEDIDYLAEHVEEAY